jgi:predicted amidohydrolase
LNTAAGASLAAIARPSSASQPESSAGVPQGPPPITSQPAASAPRSKDAVSVSRRGQYEKAALRSDFVNVAAIQSRVRAVDGNNPGPGLKEGLEHALKLIDYAQGASPEWGGERVWGQKQDLICMHEFPIQGWAPWTRAQIDRIAYELPGSESAAIGAKAKKYGCYIAFGCYAKDKDWPGHFINMSVIVGPSGEIVAKHWKARNILGAFGDIALFGSTVYDVLERYVEMYGQDAVIPIARTDIGNIAMTAVGNEPALYQAMMMKGAELLILSVTGGSNGERAAQTARDNRVYVVGVGNSVSPDNWGFAESAGARDGGTIIADPRGNLLASTANHHEDIISARIPLGDFRKTYRPAEIPMALLLPVYQQYEANYKPGAWLEYLPRDLKDAGEFVRRRVQSGLKK